MKTQGRYDQGYKAGWNHRQKKRARFPRVTVRRKQAEYRLGFEHGWHDGEGRGQTWEEFQRTPLPPRPRSWRKYEA